MRQTAVTIQVITPPAILNMVLRKERFANQSSVIEIRTFKERFRSGNLSKDYALKSKIENLYTYVF